MLAVLSQLTVWSAAWWCHLAALWLCDCVLYPDISVGVRLLGAATGHADVVFCGWADQCSSRACRAGSHLLSSYLRRQRENLAGTTCPVG